MQKLKMNRASPKRHVLEGDGNEFEVMINPDSFKHDQKICYNAQPVIGQGAQAHRFHAVGPDTVSFDILLDGTGVLARESQVEDVIQQLRSLRGVVYDIKDESQGPSLVRLLWGTFLFFGRLRSMNVNYTLFKPSGDPLRAKVAMSFAGSVRHGEGELSDNRNRANVVKSIEVKEGDRLDHLCSQVYGDPGYAEQVAHHNDLAQLTPLKPGTRLNFPALA